MPNPPQLPAFIYGLHDIDRAAQDLLLSAGRPGWVLDTVDLRSQAGTDYTSIASAGLGIIVRLNNGYGTAGTIPSSGQYDAFAIRCADYVRNSPGARIWIIGNEMNISAERPQLSDGSREVITPAKYADCFFKCRSAIKNLPGHTDDWVIPGAVGPYNNETTYPENPTGDWVQYLVDLFNLLGTRADGIAIHAYTHDFRADQIDSEQLMDPPFDHRYYQFRVYRDFLNALPDSYRSLPVLITEANPFAGWRDSNVAWIQAAYQEIQDWNADPARQPIQALVLFRWQALNDHPEWGIQNKPALIADLKGALESGYRVRPPGVRVKRAPAPPPDYRVQWKEVIPIPGNTMPAHSALTGRVVVKNTGAKAWNAGGPNPVRLGYHWYNERGFETPVAPFSGNWSLARDVPAGSSITVSNVELRAPQWPGRYTLKWDLVQEGINWFTTRSSPTKDITVQVTPLASPKPATPKPAPVPTPAPATKPAAVTPAATAASAPAAAATTAPTPAPAKPKPTPEPAPAASKPTKPTAAPTPTPAPAPVKKAAEIPVAAAPPSDGKEAKAPATPDSAAVAPAAASAAPASATLLSAPASPSGLLATTTLPRSSESSAAAAPAPAPAPAVMPAPAEAAPITRRDNNWQALFIGHDTPVCMNAGETTSVNLTVKNVGDNVWYQGGNVPVHVGYKWYNEQGQQQLDVDDRRTALRSDIPPGTTEVLGALLASPKTPGKYQLRLDLVAEGVTWFADTGNPPLVVPLSVTNVPRDITNWRAESNVNHAEVAFSLDGDPRTYWDSRTPQAPGQWFRLNLSAPRVISGIQFLSPGKGAPAGYCLRVSQDGANWTEIARTQSDNIYDVMAVFAPLTVKYAQIDLLAPSAVPSDWMISEILIHPATLWTATASHNSAGAGKAIDNDPETLWSSNMSQMPGMWFQLDLGRVEIVSGLTLKAPADRNPFGFRISAWNAKASKWQIASEKTNNLDQVDVSFVATQTQFINIQLLKSFNKPWTIQEVRLIREMDTWLGPAS